MKGDIIPDSDHVARYCKPSTIEDCQIQATAFQLRPKDKSLSVNWLEFLKCSDRNEEIAAIQKVYNNKLKVRSNARVAVLNVGKTRSKVLFESVDQRSLEFKHNPLDFPDDPLKTDPSHSGIYNIKHDDEMIAELILSVIEPHHIYPAKA